MKIIIRKRTIFIFLTLIGLLAYYNSFSAPFHYDDISFLRENTSIKSWQFFSSWIKESYSRIITGRAFLLFTFYLNYVVNGLDTFGYHIVNLFVHISTAFLFYLLIAKYVYPRTPIEGETNAPQPPFITPPSPSYLKRGRLEGVLSGGGEGGVMFASPVPILAASLFLLHPINTESVTYISSRSSELSAFFILAAMLCFFRATQKNIGRSQEMLNQVQHDSYKPSLNVTLNLFQGLNRLFIYLLSILFFILGLSTKEAAIVTPLLIGLFDLYFVSANRKNFLSRIKYHLPFWGITLAVAFYYLGHITHPAMHGRPWLTHILTELKVFIEYIKLLILPLWLNIDHDIKAAALFDVSTAAAVVFVAGILLSAFFLRKQNRVLSFSIFWFFINLAPFFAIRLEDYMAERWVYAASLGFALFAGELLVVLHAAYKTIGKLAIACIFIFFGIFTWLRNDIYKDPVMLWTDAAEKSPAKARPYTNLCAYYVERKETDKAIEICKIAIDRGGRTAETYINLATAYFFKEDLNNAEAILLSLPKVKGMKVSSGIIETYHYNLGLAYKGRKKYYKAIDEYKKVLKLKPQSPAALGLIAESYFQLGDMKKADEYAFLATRGMPQNGEDYLMLAKSFLHLGETRKGIESLSKAVTTDPLNGNIRYSVATVYLEGKNYDLAYKHFSILSKLSPQFAPAYMGMGKAMLEKGSINEARKYLNKALSLLPPDSPDRKEISGLLEKTRG